MKTNVTGFYGRAEPVFYDQVSLVVTLKYLKRKTLSYLSLRMASATEHLSEAQFKRLTHSLRLTSP